MKYEYAPVALFAAMLASPVLAETTTTETFIVNGQEVIVDTTTLPGDAILPLEQALDIFADVCVATLPNFIGAEARMAANGANHKANTGTVFHPTVDASFKVAPRSGRVVCSMVTASDATEAVLSAALSERFAGPVNGPAGPAWRVDTTAGGFVVFPQFSASPDGYRTVGLRLIGAPVEEN